MQHGKLASKRLQNNVRIILLTMLNMIIFLYHFLIMYSVYTDCCLQVIASLYSTDEVANYDFHLTLDRWIDASSFTARMLQKRRRFHTCSPLCSEMHCEEPWHKIFFLNFRILQYRVSRLSWPALRSAFGGMKI